MCLIVRSIGKTNKEVEVYKILLKKDDKLYSPFKRWFNWELDVIYTDSHKESLKKKNGIIKAGDGFIHSYTHLYRAENRLRVISKKYKDCKFYIYKAIIPENTQVLCDNNGQICSKSLKITVCV